MNNYGPPWPISQHPARPLAMRMRMRFSESSKLRLAFEASQGLAAADTHLGDAGRRPHGQDSNATVLRASPAPACESACAGGGRTSPSCWDRARARVRTRRSFVFCSFSPPTSTSLQSDPAAERSCGFLLFLPLPACPLSRCGAPRIESSVRGRQTLVRDWRRRPNGHFMLSRQRLQEDGGGRGGPSRPRRARVGHSAPGCRGS